MLNDSLVCVFSDGKYRLALWHNVDGSPQHMGCHLAEAARGLSIDQLKLALRDRVTLLEHWDDPASPAHLAHADPSTLLRAIHDSSAGDAFAIHDDLAYVGDSARNNWTYVLDLDAGTFELHTGSNRQPLQRGDRFFGYLQEHTDYYPVRLLRSWPLDALPDEQELRSLDPQHIRTVPRPPSASSRPAPQPVVF
ncbi:MAG: hypothetical protein ACRER5_16145 [Pseudomonas sp.]